LPNERHAAACQVSLLTVNYLTGSSSKYHYYTGAGNEEKTNRRLMMNIIKVSAKSRTSAVAGAIAGVMRDMGRAEVQAIGAGAVNQAVKAIVIAKGYLAEEGVDIVCTPSFVEIMIDGQERTAVRLLIEPKANSSSS
jgi:stage V sporulation protein S